MKQTVSFRLNQNMINILEVLSINLHISKTEVIEKAVKNYSRKLKFKNSKLAKYSAAVDGDLMDRICDSAYSNRKSINISRDLQL